MNLHEAAAYWRQRLSQGKPINRVRVRRLLELAGAERRGVNIMNGIRQVLEKNDLVTDPDFQAVWPDTQVALKLVGQSYSVSVKPDEQHVGSETIEQQIDPAIEPTATAADREETKGETLGAPPDSAGLVEIVTLQTVDPVARVSSIQASCGGVATVLLSDSLELAMTKMSFDGYSQLAIMQNDREVRGMISWESIAKRSMQHPAPVTVGDCRVDAQVVDADSSLFDAMPAITRFGYVLVRSREKKITGIVTASDFAAEFSELSYAFISLRSIEINIRGKLHPVLQDGDFLHLEEHSLARREEDSSLLTFGENVRLLQRQDIWQRLNLTIDKGEVTRRLLEVRDIRNEVMHFGPEPITASDKKKLLQMEEFLRQAFA